MPHPQPGSCVGSGVLGVEPRQQKKARKLFGCLLRSPGGHHWQLDSEMAGMGQQQAVPKTGRSLGCLSWAASCRRPAARGTSPCASPRKDTNAAPLRRASPLRPTHTSRRGPRVAGSPGQGRRGRWHAGGPPGNTDSGLVVGGGRGGGGRGGLCPCGRHKGADRQKRAHWLAPVLPRASARHTRVGGQRGAGVGEEGGAVGAVVGEKAVRPGGCLRGGRRWEKEINYTKSAWETYCGAGGREKCRNHWQNVQMTGTNTENWTDTCAVEESLNTTKNPTRTHI